jgi:hypothetical protein
MKAEAASTAPSSSPEADITVHNRLYHGHRYQAAMDEVLRVALRGLPGPWEASVYPVGRGWFRIDVVAPDGARWSMSVPAHEGPSAQDLAETVRAAGVRHCRLKVTECRRGAAIARDLGDTGQAGAAPAPAAGPPRDAPPGADE